MISDVEFGADARGRADFGAFLGSLSPRFRLWNGPRRFGADSGGFGSWSFLGKPLKAAIFVSSQLFPVDMLGCMELGPLYCQKEEEKPKGA